MSLPEQRNTQKRTIVIVSILMAISMVFSTVVGLFQSVQNAPQVAFTPTPAATVPPPPDVSSISFDQTYLQPSGLFTAAIPTGWVPTNQFATTGEAQVTMRNTAALSVLEIRVIRPTSDQVVSSVDDLSTVFNAAWLNSSWREYSSWSESVRRIEDDRLVIDFNLNRQGQSYVARQVAFAEGDRIYTVRIVTPSNATEMLTYVLDNELASLQIIDRYAEAPLEWGGYFDDTSDHLIRFPGTWAVVDAAEGAPASISGEGVQMRVEALDAPIASSDAAAEYVSGLRSGITVLSVVDAEQFGNSGYRVAYTLATVDGDTESGAVLLLNNESQAYAANVLLAAISDTNLNEVDLEAEDTPQVVRDALGALSSLSLFPDLDISTQ